MTEERNENRNEPAEPPKGGVGIYREPDEILDRMAELNRTYLWQVDPDGMYTFVSGAMEAILGYRPGDLVGRVRFYDLHPEDGREAFRAAVFAGFSRKEAFRILEKPMYSKDGAVLWFSMSAVPLLDDDGRLFGYRGTDMEITDKKRAEDKLRESEAQYAAIVEKSPLGIVLHDAGGAIVYTNDAFARMVDVSPSGIVGRSYFDFVHPDDRDESVRRVCRDLANGAPVPLREHRLVRRDSAEIPVESTGTMILRNNRMFILGIFQDITARKRTELVRKAHRAIADGIAGSETPGEVVGIVRRELGELMDMRNFMIAEYDEATKTLRALPDLSLDEKELLACWSAERSLTGMVIRNGRTMRFTKAEIRRFADEGVIDLVGARSEVWFGIPLQNNDRVFGALVVQSYDTPEAFTDADIEVLRVTASQLGVYLEKKRAEAEATDARRRLADIIDFLPDATMAVDREKRVIIWNRAMEEMTGIPAADMIGRGNYAYSVPFYAHTRPQLIDLIFGDSPEAAAAYPSIIRKGDVFETEAFCPAMYGGRGGWIYAKASPLRDAFGGVAGAIESVRDISERKRFELLLAGKTQELERHQEAIIASMAILAEYRDRGTSDHVIRTKEYFRLLLERSGGDALFPPEHIPLLWQAATLHDIGKVGVPDMILLKPGKLTPAEFDIAKRHTTIGGDVLLTAAKILGDAPFIAYARQITEYHHEKWDGSGYPHGLKGEAIPFIARVMAIADVYDALVSGRPYKNPMSHEEAVSIIRSGAGVHFDPRLVDVFLECAPRFDEIARMNGD